MRPTAWWYLLSLVVVAALGAAGVVAVRAAFDTRERIFLRDVTRYPVNERGTVTFESRGSYTLFFEAPTVLLGSVDTAEIADQLDIRFVEVATGQPVLLHHSHAPDTASNGEMDRVAISSFMIERPGDYLLSTRTTEFSSDVASVSVGRDSITMVLLAFFVGVWLFVSAVLCGGATAIAIGGLRGRSKRGGLASGVVPDLPPAFS